MAAKTTEQKRREEIESAIRSLHAKVEDLLRRLRVRGKPLGSKEKPVYVPACGCED